MFSLVASRRHGELEHQTLNWTVTILQVDYRRTVPKVDVVNSIAIILSPDAFNSWKASGCEIHNNLGPRVIGTRLLMKDNMNNDIGLFLISAYAPIGRAKQPLWDKKTVSQTGFFSIRIRI